MDEQTKQAHASLDAAIAKHGHEHVSIHVHGIGAVWVGIKKDLDALGNAAGEALGEAMDQR